MSSTQMFNLGIDLAQDSFEAALSPEHPDTEAWRDLPHLAVHERPESNEAIRTLCDWVEETIPRGKVARVVVESTGVISKRFASALAGHGLPAVAIVNPRRTKAFGDSMGLREKTDRTDAAMLAIYAAQHRPKPQKPKSALRERLQRISRLRESYVNDHTAWLNRLHNALDSVERKCIKQTLRHLEGRIEALEAMTDKTVRERPDLSNQIKCLKRVPGYGKVLSTTVSAEDGLLCEYSRGQIVGTNGVFPKRFESGKTVHRAPRMAKGGGARVRRVLYMGAMSLYRTKGPFRDQIDALEARGLSKKCIIGIMMRKLLLVGRAVMKNGGRYDPEMVYRPNA